MVDHTYSQPVTLGRHFGFPDKSPWDDIFEQLTPLGQFTWFREISADLDHGRVEVDGYCEMLMLGGYSYLGLNRHPAIKDSLNSAVSRFGTGTSGSRWLAGHTSLHRLLEQKLAALHGTEDSVVFSSGYTANVSAVAALVNRDDLVVTDKCSHASVVDGCRFSNATFQRFRFKDLDHLRHILSNGRTRFKRRLVVVDGVYSMSGDILDAPEVVKLCHEFDAALMVDECHSHFVLGQHGHGIKEHFALPANAITLEMGTLSKAIPANGGYIAASRDLCNFLRRSARGFIYSGATSAAMIASAIAAIDVFQATGSTLIAQLQSNATVFRESLRDLGFEIEDKPVPIVPILVGDEHVAAAAATACQQKGLFIHPVFPPVVAPGRSILRASIMANHRPDDLRNAASIIANSIKAARKLANPSTAAG